MHARAPAGDLVGKRRGARGRGLGIRHLEHGGDAAQHRRTAPRLQILLVGQARLAEMHLGVDDAGEHMQAGSIEDPRCARTGKRADGGDAAVDDADI